MASKVTDKPRLHYWKPIGYFEAKSAINLLMRYEDLVRHFYNFSGGIQAARPIEELIKKDEKKHPWEQIKTEIIKMTSRMHRCFYRIGLSPIISWTSNEREYDYEKHIPKFVDKEHKADIFMDFLFLSQQDSNGLKRQSAYEYIIMNIETAIGEYERIKNKAWKRWFNPLWIIATILRTPISIMEFMGVDSDNEKTSNFIFWLIQALMAILLLLLITRLGLSISYQDILK
jgi:hypothetical protein